MPLHTQSIPALYGGVSQQAAVSRPPSQCEEAENCWFSVAQGVSKRPPLESVRLLSSEILDDAYWQWYRHENGEWLLLVIPGDGSYRVFRVSTGSQLTLLGTTTGISYLQCDGDPWHAFTSVNADGNVFIVNREVTCLMTSDQSAGSLTGTVDTLQSDDLSTATAGEIWKIMGTEALPFSVYYAKKTSGGSAEFWTEWVEPGIPFKVDAATLPVKLKTYVNTSNPELFECEIVTPTWGEREVGDTNSNEAPSFLGKPIRGIFFLHDRLVLTAGDSMSMSRVGEYTQFFRTSVTSVLDDDRIDVSAKNDDVVEIDHMASVSGKAVVFGTDRQYQLTGDPALTPSSVTMEPITRYPANPNVKPQVTGPNVYFAADAGEFTHVREMFLQSDAVTLDAANTSAHTFAYVPRNPRQLEVHPDYETIFITPSPTEYPGTIWTYQYKWVGDEKAMSAWGKWTLPGEALILSVQVIDHYLYVIFRDTQSGDTQMGRFDLNAGNRHASFTHKIYLDHLTQGAPDYNSVEDKTYYTMPVDMMGRHSEVMVVDATEDANKGKGTNPSNIDGFIDQPDTRKIVFSGDTTGRDYWFGFKYTMRYRFSEQFLREQNNAVMTARTQIRNMLVHFQDTAYFRVRVKTRGHEENEMHVMPALRHTYVARTLSDEHFTNNGPQLDSGVFDFPVLGKASDAIIELINDSYVPCHFQSAEWRALVSSRMGR